MPEGERVSMTAVSEARTLKVVLTGMPCSSFPSQSPERDWSFLNAAAECVPAHSGPAMDAASKRTEDSLRRVTDAPRKERRRKWTSRNLGRRKLSVWTAELREREQWRPVSRHCGGTSRAVQQKSAVGPRWTRGASAATLFVFRLISLKYAQIRAGTEQQCFAFTPRVSRTGRRCLRLSLGCPRNYRLT